MKTHNERTYRASSLEHDFQTDLIYVTTLRIKQGVIRKNKELLQPSSP